MKRNRDRQENEKSDYVSPAGQYDANTGNALFRAGKDQILFQHIHPQDNCSTIPNAESSGLDAWVVFGVL